LARERQHLLAREGASGILDRPLFLGEFEVHAATDTGSALDRQSTGGGRQHNALGCNSPRQGAATEIISSRTRDAIVLDGNHEHGVASADAGNWSTRWC
jgi:hypothetical protein